MVYVFVLVILALLSVHGHFYELLPVSYETSQSWVLLL